MLHLLQKMICPYTCIHNTTVKINVKDLYLLLNSNI